MFKYKSVQSHKRQQECRSYTFLKKRRQKSILRIIDVYIYFDITDNMLPIDQQYYKNHQHLNRKVCNYCVWWVSSVSNSRCSVQKSSSVQVNDRTKTYCDSICNSRTVSVWSRLLTGSSRDVCVSPLASRSAVCTSSGFACRTHSCAMACTRQQWTRTD